MILLKLLVNYQKSFVLPTQQPRKSLRKHNNPSKCIEKYDKEASLNKYFLFSKIVIHQPKRLQSKLEDAFTIVQGVGDKIKSFIQEKV